MTPVENVTEAREQLLDELLAEYLRAMQEGRAPSRQQLTETHPDLASELAEFFADQDHIERLAAPLRAIAPAPAPEPGTTLGDYELLAEIAQGGMGVVYRARQRSLNRIVALKVLLAGPLASAEQARRFRAEAEAIAALDHPNIVPVYEVGIEQGLPYFSMKLLTGGSLARTVSEGRPALGPAEAARLVATVADAVQYAHDRGILHRDLKPANVLLDEAGVPHVGDFGLAKRTTAPDAAITLPADTPFEDAARTLSGAIVGTPSYMAPEQAAGSRLLTTATDVYGLGAILYELLTGRPPFRGDTFLDTLRRLQEEEPVPPRSLAPRLDRDLETICLTCLHKEPARRYAAARELAADLRRYLRGEPIMARPVGPLERFWRWCRRRPLAAAVSLAFAAVIVTAFVLVDHARRNEHASNTAKGEANARLARSRDRALQAIDDVCVRLSEDGWSEDPATHERRKKLLEAVLRYQRDFLDDPEGEAPARAELVRACFRIGDLASALGKPEEALVALDRGRGVAETVLRLHPDEDAVRIDLARIHNRIGQLHKNAGRAEAALASYGSAYDLLTALRREVPNDLHAAGELSVTCNNLGSVLRSLGRPNEARARYRECIDLNRDLARRSTDLQYPYALALSLGNDALLAYATGERETAWKHLDEANKLLRDTVRADSSVGRYRQGLGQNLYNRGCKLYDEKRYDRAIVELREARDVLTRLVESQPRIPQYREDLARTLRQLGHAHRASRQRDKPQLDAAIDAYQSAHKVYREMIAANPRSADLRYDAAGCSFDVGLLQSKCGRKNEAIQAYQEARMRLLPVVRSFPDRLSFRNLLGLTLNNLGHELTQANRPEEARTSLQEAREHNRQVHERAPQNASYRRVLNTTYIFLAEVYRDASQRDEQIAVLKERRSLWPDNPPELVLIACELARAGAGDEALRTLEGAAAAGYHDTERLEREPALTELRQRAEFRKLVQGMKGTRP